MGVNGGMESRAERAEREARSYSVSPPSSPPRSKPSPASAKAKKKSMSPHLSHQEYSPNKKSPRKPAPADNAVVSDYGVKIQNDHWPIQCIKCNLVTGDLENFNLHMNDHWSEDECCPVCGLLINSKRFNFKQHLKIHTGEKPFVCNICNRSFRQKAHMVKHVTTHTHKHTHTQTHTHTNTHTHKHTHTLPSPPSPTTPPSPPTPQTPEP